MNWHKREQHLEDRHDVEQLRLGSLDTEEQRALHTYLHHTSQQPDHDHPESEY